MKVAWDPLAVAGLFWVIALLLYVFGHAPRWFGFLAAAGMACAIAGVPSLLALAHHPLAPGLSALIVIVGAAGGVLLFWFIVIKGHHKHPMLKLKSAQASGDQAAKGQGSSRSKKAPHHRAAVAFAAALVFVFLAASNWNAVFQTGRGGVSQTVSGFIR